MPIIEKKEKSELTGALDSFLTKKRVQKSPDGRDEYDPEFLTILEFIDRFKLFPYGLYPVQRFILKLYYNLPLDDVLPEDPGRRIVITRGFRKKDSVEVTEVQYLQHLYDQGRCNVREQDGRERRELILVLGRRSGKSALAAIIAAYELYKLIRRGFPQVYYGMPSGSEIRIFCIANDKDQAGIVYGDMSNHVNQVDYFKSSITHDTQTYMKFRTASDAARFRHDDRKATITATFKSSIAKGLRGRGVICCILDELAFFVNDGKSSAESVYRAINPALKQFSPKDPKNRHRPLGPSEGRMICISSPDAREGLFYKLYEMALSKDRASANMLMIQAPTWEVNPTLDESEYEVERAKDPRAFETEYGASFSDRVRGWIENAQDLMDCVDPALRPLVRGTPREPFFCGLDFALVNDGTSVALSHIADGAVRLAYHETWYAGRPWKEANPHLPAPLVPYAHALSDQPRLDLDEIIGWILQLSKRFYIHRGVFDQWAGTVFEQKLHKVGLTQFEMRNFSTAETSQMFQSTKMLMLARQLSLYDYPVPEAASGSTLRHSPHVAELLELQASSGGKNIVVVEAPEIPGKHDDFSDAYVRSNYLATEYIRENPGVLDAGRHVLSVPAKAFSVGYHQFQRSRMRAHGPPPRERRVPAGMRAAALRRR